VNDRQIGFFWSVRYLLISICLLFNLTGCSLPQRVSANERIFRNFSLEFVDQYQIPKATFQDTKIGGLSAIAYQREEDKFYVLSDDRGRISPARFYTFQLRLKQADQDIKIASFKPEKVTLLRDEEDQNYKEGNIDPEGLTLSPRGTVFISSEGNPSQDIKPFIAEYELDTGKKIANIPLPKHFFAGEEPDIPQGIQENLAFESLTINRISLPQDPFRVFTATESALVQDDSIEGEEQAKIRFLHYVINPVGNPVLIAEHLYLLDSAPVDVFSNGLTELLTLKTEGYFLSLERTFGFTGAGAKIFQVVIGNATDTSNIRSFKGDIQQITPLKKQLLLNLEDLEIELDNLEGMTIGPRLPDGNRSLILISDDNFNDEQISQLLLFRLLEN